MSRIVLAVSDLKVDFYNRDKLTNSPLRGLDFEVAEGRTLGIVGEVLRSRLSFRTLIQPSTRSSRSATNSLSWPDGTIFLGKASRQFCANV
jgi:ABC-type microcin C transport system duplicated ATPase subunit YejF